MRDDSSSGTWEGWGSELEGYQSDCAPTTRCFETHLGFRNPLQAPEEEAAGRWDAS